MRKDLIAICYVEDLGIQVPKKEIVDTLIAQLCDLGFGLTFKQSFSKYLDNQYTKISGTEI